MDFDKTFEIVFFPCKDIEKQDPRVLENCQWKRTKMLLSKTKPTEGNSPIKAKNH